MLRIGLLGVGHLGKIHIKCLKATHCWNLVGFYDPNEALAIQVAQQLEVPRFENLESLLAAVDAVDIVTPTHTHYELACRALEAGKHVFIEKPLTETGEEGRSLLRLARGSRLKVQVGHVERFNPAFMALQGMALKPMFIEGHRLSAFQPRGTDVSVILDLMIHDLDLILHLNPAPVQEISASGVAVLSQTIDIANARIIFEDGCVANLTASRISLKQMRKMRLFQKDHYISMDFLEKQAQIIRLYDLNAPQLPPEEERMVLDTQGGQKWLHMQMAQTPEVNAIQQELETFYDCILHDNRPVVSLEDGLRALELAHAILEDIDKRMVAVGQGRH
jgi:predicted dehydrogenase